MRHSRKGSSRVVCGPSSLLLSPSSPLKASRRSIDLTPSHTLRRPSQTLYEAQRPVGTCPVASREAHSASGKEEKYIILCMRWRGRDRCLDGRLCPRERAGTSWPSPSPPCLEPPNRDRVRLHVGVRPAARPPARDRRTDDGRSVVRTGKEAAAENDGGGGFWGALNGP